MPFKPGQPKIAGRKKGTPNKSTTAVREIVENALGGKTIPERLVEIAKQNPRLEADILVDLLPYAHPKLQAVDHTVDLHGSASHSVDELVEWLKKTREIK